MCFALSILCRVNDDAVLKVQHCKATLGRLLTGVMKLAFWDLTSSYSNPLISDWTVIDEPLGPDLRDPSA